MRWEWCVWSLEDDECEPYYGSCGIQFCFTEGGIADNRMTYCPECGGRIYEQTEKQA